MRNRRQGQSSRPISPLAKPRIIVESELSDQKNSSFPLLSEKRKGECLLLDVLDKKSSHLDASSIKSFPSTYSIQSIGEGFTEVCNLLL